MKIMAMQLQASIKQFVCDRCRREADCDDMNGEFQEFISIQHTGGYGSIFGDCNEIGIDLCQQCLKETLGSWIRVTDPMAGFNPAEHGGEFPYESSINFVPRGLAAINQTIEGNDGLTADQVIAGLEKRLAQARAELYQRQRTTQFAETTALSFAVGAPVVTNCSLPHLDLELGARGSVVQIHGDGSAYDVEFVNRADETLIVKMVEANSLSPWSIT